LIKRDRASIGAHKTTGDTPSFGGKQQIAIRVFERDKHDISSDSQASPVCETVSARVHEFDSTVHQDEKSMKVRWNDTNRVHYFENKNYAITKPPVLKKL